MDQINKKNEAREMANNIREIIHANGKVVSDYAMGYLMGRVEAETERRKSETTKRSDAGVLPEPEADRKAPENLGAEG